MLRDVPAVGLLRRISLGGLGIGVIACALPSTASAQISSCPRGDNHFGSLPRARAEASVPCLSNAARIAAGLDVLKAHGQLRTAARRHADDMESRGYFDHVAPAP